MITDGPLSSANVRSHNALRSRSRIARSSSSGGNIVTDASSLNSDGPCNSLSNESVVSLSSGAALLSAMPVIAKSDDIRDAESDEVSTLNPGIRFVMAVSDAVLVVIMAV